jgi:hypothetical protein
MNKIFTPSSVAPSMKTQPNKMCALPLHHGQTWLTGQNLSRVFNYRRVRIHAVNLICSETKRSNLKLKTWPRQLLGPLPLDSMLPTLAKYAYPNYHILNHRDKSIDMQCARLR